MFRVLGLASHTSFLSPINYLLIVLSVNDNGPKKEQIQFHSHIEFELSMFFFYSWVFSTDVLDSPLLSVDQRIYFATTCVRPIASPNLIKPQSIERSLNQTPLQNKSISSKGCNSMSWSHGTSLAYKQKYQSDFNFQMIIIYFRFFLTIQWNLHFNVTLSAAYWACSNADMYNLVLIESSYVKQSTLYIFFSLCRRLS